jgi:non-heme chloroperoxidase
MTRSTQLACPARRSPSARDAGPDSMMLRARWHRSLAAAIVLVSTLVVIARVAGQESVRTWRDPSPHQVRFVTVDEGVTLELLDWGGPGRPIVLLAGSGNTAHAFDELAPKLTDCCHVYGITRRGYGASSKPSLGYDDQRLADDVFRVIERERIPAPILVGHSMAGGELTTVGRQHSDRLGGLVYMDGLADLEDDPAADPEWQALQQKLPPGLNPAPRCGPMDRSSFAAYRLSLACRFGFQLPESELRNMFETSNGGVGASRSPEWVGRSIGQGQVFRKDFSNIRVPVLVLLNATDTTEGMLASTGYQPKNAEERAAIDRFAARGVVMTNRWTDKLTRHVPNARIVKLGLVGHYVHFTREAEVLREIRAFVAATNGPR